MSLRIIEKHRPELVSGSKNLILCKYGGCRQVVKTTDCGSVMRGFESHHPPHKKDFGLRQGLFYLSDEGENSVV